MTDFRGGRLLASVAFALCATACASTQFAKGSPTDLLDSRKPGAIDIYKIDGTHVHLYKPVVRRDTIWGNRSGSEGVQDGAVALKDVSAVSTRQFSAGKTVLLVVLGAAAIFAVAVVTTVARGGIC